MLKIEGKKKGFWKFYQKGPACPQPHPQKTKVQSEIIKEKKKYWINL
jgi:hypothetical protein